MSDIDDSPDAGIIQRNMQRTAHDVYVLQFVIDDLWRDFNSIGGIEILHINRHTIVSLSNRLHALITKVWDYEQSKSDATERSSCATD